MHLEQLPSGNWRAVVIHRRVRRSVTRRTKAEARVAGAQVLIEMGGSSSDEAVTVGELVVSHIADREKEWSPTYLDEMRRIERRLPAEFLDRPVGKVTVGICLGLQRQLAGEGWSAHRVNRARDLLSGAWGRALTLGWASTNPWRDAPPPKRAPRDVAPPAHDDVRRLLEAATGVEAVAFRLAAATGCRRSEVVAFQWVDVDLDQADVVVRRSLVYSPSSGVVERATKTGRRGHRVLALDEGTVTLLRAHRQRQVAQAVANGLPAPVWVVSHDAGVTPWRPDLLTHRFVRARAAVGLPESVRLHDLRHYVATSMLEDGVPLIDVAAQLGHTSISTTERTYAHFMPGRGRESAEQRGRRLG